ncbi:hypothetical protein ACFQE1_14885, partial [Halobium palmae]
ATSGARRSRRLGQADGSTCIDGVREPSEADAANQGGPGPDGVGQDRLPFVGREREAGPRG